VGYAILVAGTQVSYSCYLVSECSRHLGHTVRPHRGGAPPIVTLGPRWAWDWWFGALIRAIFSPASLWLPPWRAGIARRSVWPQAPCTYQRSRAHSVPSRRAAAAVVAVKPC